MFFTFNLDLFSATFSDPIQIDWEIHTKVVDNGLSPKEILGMGTVFKLVQMYNFINCRCSFISYLHR